MKIALYCRVSTAIQFEKGNSIPEQKKRLKAYCESRGWNDYEFFVDPGHSGSNMDRPGLQDLIRKVKDFDMVLVYKLDRLSRNQRDILYLIEDVFKKNGVEFNSITENFDTSTPVGKLMLSMMGAFAELERQQINERMMMGRIASASKGLWRGGSGVPTGYKYISKRHGGDGNLTIDEDQAKIVREMFNLFEAGYTCNALNVKFNFSGASVVKRLLQNPVYIGKIKYAGEVYDAHHEPIISEEQFDRVQKELRQREIDRNYPTAQKHLLTGFLKCSCGAKVCFHQCTKKGKNGTLHYEYYECYSRMCHGTMKTQSGCNNKVWKAKELECVVWDSLLEMDFEDFEIRDDSEQIEEIEKEIRKIEKQIEKLMDLYTLDGIPLDALQSRLNALNSRKKALDDTLYPLLNKSPKMDEKAFSDSKRQIDKIREMDVETQRSFLGSLVKEIVLLPDHDLQFKMNF